MLGLKRAFTYGYAGTALALFPIFGIEGCPNPPQESCECPAVEYNPSINPANFVAEVTNPYFPLTPGTRFTYETATDEGTERVVVLVTARTVEVMGVTCTVVRDTVTLDGELVEDTFDWYAQDVDGNVWYFGEASMEFEEGMVRSTFGSWEGGIDCAKPGIIMLANPVVDQTYRQEFYQCIAEDMATVGAIGETVVVPRGSFENCLRTEEFTPLDPDVEAEKLYAPGIGQVLTLEDGERVEELVNIETGVEEE